MRHLSVRALGLAVLVASFAACDDAPTDANVFVASREVRAVLGAELPRLPSLIDRALRSGATLSDADRAALRNARAMWLEGAQSGDSLRDALTGEANALALGPLSRSIPPAQLAAVQDSLSRWADLAGSIPGVGALPEVKPTIDAAQVHLAEARKTVGRDPEASLRSTLAASDALLSTSPPVLARRLLERTEAALDQVSRPAPGPARDRYDRARRLARGAHEALEDEQTLLGLRRAYYAWLLIDKLPAR